MREVVLKPCYYHRIFCRNCKAINFVADRIVTDEYGPCPICGATAEVSYISAGRCTIALPFIAKVRALVPRSIHDASRCGRKGMLASKKRLALRVKGVK